jgi:valyl-tRNA synthetase
MELEKVYEPKSVEEKWYKAWEGRGCFRANNKSEEKPYSIVIPPPNVTGSLHMGHALNNTLQDILARYKRMQGYDVLWLPGMDHAGIATQNVVEKLLHKEGKTRDDLGREAFIERVWKWKEESGGAIINQLKRLGSSCDWSRERFTMDEGLSKAVREVFVRLYEEGLIYRDERLINWCPRCLTALSDIEVEHEETDGTLFYIKYPIYQPPATGHQPPEYLIVATTRPETMLGDTAVAVHPEDERFNHLIGKEVLLPLTSRRIPIIADPMVDREFGTGAVKITPAHDFNDFEAGNRHDLPRINIFTDKAHMKPVIEGVEPDVFEEIKDLHAHKAREKVVHILKERGFLTKHEPHKHAVGRCYRCRTVVEPFLSSQWYVKIKPLAEPAIKAVEDGGTRFVPKSWENTYFEWMRNIKDWCISRQIWWGHRIPVWYCQEMQNEKCKMQNGVVVSRETPNECPHCGSKRLAQDPDVLDTWFSSALWPFSTLGWPEKTEDLRRYYPTSALVTGFDIIFFWVARMMMMGLKFMDDVPFRDVYIHALVRDAQGQKMSKSKGNVIDPLVIMEKYGTDAFRFTLAAMAAQGRDIKLSEERIEGYRNFANKIWNAARFSMMNLKDYDPAEIDPAGLSYSLADRWIVMRMNSAVRETLSALESYRFNDAANAIYHFIWHELCDWYIELAKPVLQGKGSPEERRAVQHVLFSTMETSMRLLHPFMPFITEEIWQTLTQCGKLTGGRFDRSTGFVEEGLEGPSSIMISDYPMYSDILRDTKAEEGMGLVIEAIKGIRNLRAELNVPPSAAVNAHILSQEAHKRDILAGNEGYIKNLAKAGNLSISSEGEKPKGAATAVIAGMDLFVTFEKSQADRKEEVERLEKELAKVEKELAQVQNKLNNEEFIKKAPQAVIEKEKGKEVELLATKKKLEEGIKRVGG